MSEYMTRADVVNAGERVAQKLLKLVDEFVWSDDYMEIIADVAAPDSDEELEAVEDAIFAVAYSRLAADLLKGNEE